MSPLAALGARLVRAGGPLRAVSLALGCAVAVTLLAVAWALPDALYPVVTPDDVDPQRGILTSLLALVVAPVVALLLAVGRLSSTVRDRRLGSLQLLGVSRPRLALVAAVENAIPATVGALLGVGGFVAVRALLTRALDPVLRAPIGGGGRLVVVVAVVLGLSIALALTSLRRFGRARAAVAESARTTPSLWRLTPVPVALGCFAIMLATSAEDVDETTAVVLLVGLLASGIAVALVTPLVSSWASTGLARSSRVSALLAGRAIQTQPAATGRRVVALGLTAFVAFAAAGYLGVYQSSANLRYAIQTVETGPQRVTVYTDEPDPVLTLRIAPLVEGIDGVRSVREDYPVQQAGCDRVEGECLEVFTGTCADLEQRAVVTGCRDDRAAWITRGGATISPAVGTERDGTFALRTLDDSGHLEVPVDGAIDLDAAASADAFVWAPNYGVFVPSAIAATWGLPPSRLEVTIDPGDDAGAGTRRAVDEIALEYGANPVFLPELYDYQQVVTVRTTVWSIIAVAVAVALLAFALTTIDRARESRRGRARLVAVGVPARTLRRAQGLISAVPLSVAIGIGTALGVCGTSAYSHVADTSFAIEPTVLLVMVGSVLAGALAVSLATLPLTRSAVTAEDLRQE